MQTIISLFGSGENFTIFAMWTVLSIVFIAFMTFEYRKTTRRPRGKRWSD